MLAVEKALFIVVVGGLAAGSSLGLPGGSLLIILPLAILFKRLLEVEGSPSRAAQSLAIFVACLYAAGQWGAAVSVAPDLRPWTLLIWALVGTSQAAVAGLTGYLAYRLPLSARTKTFGLVPVLWVAREWGSSLNEVSVPWLALGYVQAPGGLFAGLFPIGGVYLASWATLLLSGALALAWHQQHSRQRVVALGLIITAITTAISLTSLTSSVDWTTASNQFSAELLQHGTAPTPGTESAHVLQVLRFQAETIRASSAHLIVSSQLAIAKTPEALPPNYLSKIDAALKQRSADALLGMYFESDTANEYFNGVQLVGSSGEQRYLKHHLFPFGEYLPFGRAVNDWLNSKLLQPRADSARGPPAQEPLFAAGLRLAVAICYEAAFGEALRKRAATADVLVNVASDSAHDSDQLARQFKQVAQARALELQKPLLRTSDVHGTYFIDAQGRVSGELSSHERGVSRQWVQGRTGLTPYARWGDSLVLLGLLCVLAISLLSAIGKIRGVTETGAALRVATRRRSVQHGQVLPLALGLLVIVAGFFYLMVNAGQTVTEKMRVTNAADAAAYSAAVVEARALNYDAYLNRAMVANQMAIAQIVSFASWIDYFAKASDNFGSNAADLNFFLLPNPQVVVLDVAFAGSAAVAMYFGGNSVQAYADDLINVGAGVIVSVHDRTVQALMQSQRLVQLNLTAGIRQGQVADQVVKAMDPKLNAEVVLASHGFDNFTKNYSGDERSRFADVAVRSRDPFTRERNFTVDSFSIPLLRKNPALKKRGGTELIGLDEWRAVDTLELHGRRFGCGRLGLSWCDDIKTPIGWGGIEVDAGGGDVGRGHHGNAYNENPTTASQSDAAMRSPGYASFSGIPPSQEIKDVDPAHEASTSITVRVSKSQSDTLTSGNAAQATPSGRLALFNDHPAGGQIAALSRAQVFFDRIAARADGKSELGSLYNPYWRVRLVAPTAADRAYAAAKQGGLVLP